jgi:O-antigen/teichoic acid export membrane protein
MTKYENSGQRSAERYRNSIATSIATLLAKVVSLAPTLALVPLAKPVLGDERFGILLVIVGFLSLLSFADLGLGNGLLTAIAISSGQDDNRQIKTLVSSAFFTLCGLSLLFSLTFIACSPWIPWRAFFNATTETIANDAFNATSLFLLLFFINIPLGIAAKLQMGLQKGYRNSIWTIAGSLFSLVLMTVASFTHSSLPIFVVAIMGAQTFECLLNNWILFFFNGKQYRPNLRDWDTKTANRLANTGLYFMLLQLSAALAGASDRLIISQLPNGPTEVIRFALPAILFGIIQTLTTIAIGPLWPAYGEALARGDLAWAKKTFLMSFFLVGIFSAFCSCALTFAMPVVLTTWAGDQSLTVPYSLLFGLAAWTTISSMGNCHAMLLNGASIVRQQVIAGIVFAVIVLTLKIFISKTSGISAMPWAGVLVYILILVPFHYSQFRRLFAT